MPSEPKEFQLHGTVELSLEAAAPGQDEAPARITVAAYNGGLMSVSGFGPVVIDLEGIESQDRVTLLADHENKLGSVLGSGQPIRSDGRLTIEGTLTRSVQAKQVIDLHRDGVQLQASVGAEPLETERVAKGRQAVVNGRTIRAENASFLLVKRSRLKHVAIVANGADDSTHLSIAAAAASSKETLPMEFAHWLEAKQFDPAALSEPQTASLRAMYDAERAKPVELPNPDALVADARAKLAAEADRVAQIRATCGGRHPEIEARAIREGWDEQRTQLEVKVAERPAAPMIHARRDGDRFPVGQMLEAALAITRPNLRVEDHYAADLLQAAEDRFGRRLKLRPLIAMIAQANGYTGSAYIDGETINEAMRYAWTLPLTVQASGSSTLSLPNILSNLANKELRSAFTEQDQTWREIAAIRSVSDFKTVTSHRLLDNMAYDEVAPDGELKHGRLSEETYTRQAKTYGKMFALTRDKIIDDDMGAFDDIRERLGAGAAQTLNSVFWARFLANTAFFTGGLGNYVTGADSALDLNGTGLQKAIIAFYKLKAADGKRIGGTPSILLVPPELQFNAQRLYQSTTVNTGGASTKDMVPNDNIHSGKYRPVTAVQLSDPEIPGQSAKAWYLFRAPTILAPVVVSFLDGVQTPTVEAASAEFNKLGVQFRGYFDFGVDFYEPLAGIKVKGEA